MLERFEKVGNDALADLKEVTDLAALEAFRIKYLGRKGQITGMLSQIGECPADERPGAGQLANKIKKEVSEAFEQFKNEGLPYQFIAYLFFINGGLIEFFICFSIAEFFAILF